MEMVSNESVNVIDDPVEEPTQERIDSEGIDSTNIVSEPGSESDQKAEEKPDVVPMLTLDPPDAVEAKPAAALPPLLIPSLKGKMTYEGGSVTCRGVWGMSDSAHEQPGQTSDFEFKLIKANPEASESRLFPVDGTYQGWFHLKQALPAKTPLKIEDKEMTFTFTTADEGNGYKINGKGINKFGSFTLKGTLSEEGDMHVYREYYNLTPVPVGNKRRISGDGGGEESKKRKSSAGLKVSTSDASIGAAATGGAADGAQQLVSPREGSGRIRKASSIMKEYQDMTQKPVPTPRGTSGGGSSSSSSNNNSGSSNSKGKESKAGRPAGMARQESTGGIDRAQRLPAPMKKASELLKEFCKNPQATWFLQPVDYLALNIPDYPRIITKPMDLGTIKGKIEGSEYATVDAFAEDMRLIFRNAITFNTAKDHPVHIAARELARKFEDRFRVLTTQLSGVHAFSAGAILAAEASSQKSPRGGGGGGAGGSSSSGAGGGARKSGGGAGGGAKSGGRLPKGPGRSQSMGSAGMGGPRVSSHNMQQQGGYLPPPAVDGSSAHQIMEMQRMMMSMQEELVALRTQVKQGEIVKRLQETKDAAHNPLSFEEKKTLIAQIHKLDATRMEQVLEIIQAAVPTRADDGNEEIEIPLDALDTFTLRKLQKFIETNDDKKKRPMSYGGGGGSSSSGGGGGAKRPRKSNSSYQALGAPSPATGELGLFEGNEEEALLFATDSFEELKAQAQQEQRLAATGASSAGSGSSSSSGGGGFTSVVEPNL